MTEWRLLTGLSVAPPERREHASRCAVTVTMTLMVMMTSCIPRQIQSHALSLSSVITIRHPAAHPITIGPRHHPVQPSKGDDFGYWASESPGPVKPAIPAVCNSVMPHGGNGCGLWAVGWEQQTPETPRHQEREAMGVPHWTGFPLSHYSILS
ncbi:hypothetical protein N7533_007109 [Penicillium manginii]|uniref:uncharacterized protein n=1 Tax=Penicillium manginii TaxID=203109 RepID=UPI00254857A1|nr:uncharacterized protein N7533_007109 [Penicillium manginii]KAJ5750081.1 hypothetical protein N7533_007109 [Penicillium manginii]